MLIERETTYTDTKWSRDRGRATVFRLNKRAVQKRIARARDKIALLQSNLKDMNAELIGAQQQLSATQNQLTVTTTTCNRLNDEITALIMDLEAEDGAGAAISFKVGTRNEYDCDFEICMMECLHLTSYSVAWPLMKCVYQNLTGKLLSDTPSQPWQADTIRRASVLADMQIALALLDYLAADIAVLHDGTTKRGIHLQGSQIMLNGAVFSLGVEAVADGTAVTAFNALYRRLNDCLKTVGGNVDDNLRAAMQKLHSSMSDRCPVEIKWARLLEDKKFDIIQQE